MEAASTPGIQPMVGNTYAQTVLQHTPFYFDLAKLPNLVQPRGRELVMKNTEYDPDAFLPDSKQLVRSIAIGLAVKSILFALPPLIIGVVYQSQCQVQEWIPRFLIILGVEDIAETFLVIIVLLILMVVLRKRSEPDRHKAMNTVKNIKLWVSAAFSLAWFVAGSVWTFSVKSRVQFDNFQKPDYCHSTPYWCAFVLCVIWYSHIPIAILLALRVWKIEKGKSNLNSSINPEWTVKF